MTKKTQSMTLPTDNQNKENPNMSPTSETVKDITNGVPVKGIFAEKMQRLEIQAQAEEQQLIDELENAKKAKDGNVQAPSDPVVITRPPSYGEMVAKCLNYG